MAVSPRLVTKIVNNLRSSERLLEVIEGQQTNLAIDVAEVTLQLGIRPPTRELDAVDLSLNLLKADVLTLHEKLAAMASENNVPVPGPDDPDGPIPESGGGTGKGP